MSLIERKRARPTINIVPLVDILMVLLIFLMVTMDFRNLRALNITAPKIETAGENRVTGQIVIAVSAEGEIYLNDQEIGEGELDLAMKEAGATQPDTPVLLLADENAPLKYVTLVMDICRSNQLNKVRLQSR